MRYLEERNIGFPTAFGRVPIVPAAILYDLSIGDPTIRPDAAAGYQACLNAVTEPCREGSIGAGAGATIGKPGVGKPMKGGIGTSSIKLAGGITVGAVVVVNCVGNVFDPKSGRIIAGARTEDGRSFLDIIECYRSSSEVFRPGPLENTTIGVVATNAVLTKTQMTKVAQMAHDGLARAINPVHTAFDGDTIFAMATGTLQAYADVGVIGALAAEAVSEAILRGVMRAEGVPGYPGHRDIGK
jgi:L-aminopeptidase/D-esterase-like protein